MSIYQQSKVWYSDLTRPQMAIAMALADFADDDGHCYPSKSRIGIKANYSKRQVTRLIAELREIGYLEVIAEGGPTRTPDYRLHPEVLTYDAYEKWLANRADNTPKRRGGDSMTPPPEGPEVVTPRHQGGDTDDTRVVTSGARGGDTDVTQTVIEPSDDHQEPSDAPERFVEIFVDDEPTPPADDVSRETPAKPERPRDPIWDALEAVIGYRPQGSEARQWGKAVKTLKERGATPAEIAIRSARLIAQWGAPRLTVGSLEKWWERFGSPLGAATEREAQRWVASLEDAAFSLEVAAQMQTDEPDDEPEPVEASRRRILEAQAEVLGIDQRRDDA